jgi:hypothetical protein
MCRLTDPYFHWCIVLGIHPTKVPVVLSIDTWAKVNIHAVQ